jgi:hypothetical protein
MKYKILLLTLLIIGCQKVPLDEISTPIGGGTTITKIYDFGKVSKNYNQPHHLTRQSQLSIINPHKVMIRNGVNWVNPDMTGVSFADWDGDGYEDFIASPMSQQGWTENAVEPQLYLYDSIIGDFKYEKMEFSSNQGEVVNRSGQKYIGDFDNDGDPDLLYGGYSDHNTGVFDKVWLLENNYSIDGTFKPHDMSMFITKNEVSTIDIDNDGDLDIMAPQFDEYYSIKPVMLINDGNFNFHIDESYFEMIEDVKINHAFYSWSDGMGQIFQDVNKDGHLDILWNQPSNWWNDDDSQELRDVIRGRNKIIWGGTNPYSINDFTELPTVEGYQLIDEILPWDYNNDGIDEIVVIRDNATSWDDAFTPPNNRFYIQILKLEGKSLIDITDEMIENYTGQYTWGMKPVRFLDLDGDGYLSMIRLIPNIELSKEFEWEFNGSIIKRIK